MPVMESFAGIGMIISLLAWWRSERGGQKSLEQILQALGNAQECREGFAEIRSQDHQFLTEAIQDQHEEILECLSELNLKTHQGFDDLRAEIQNTRSDMVAQFDALTGNALLHSFNDILRLPAPIEQGDKQHPSYLLNARNELVDFYGRTEELEDLHTWAEHDQPLAIRLYTAPGGMGKTRLLRQLCHTLNAMGWIAGFLAQDIEDFARKDTRLLLAAPLKTLIVVDYPQEQTGAVEKLLESLGRLLDENRVHHIRVVLLVRETGDWWDYICHKGTLRELLAPARGVAALPQPLGAIEPTVAADKRQEVYLQALKRFADILNTSAPEEIDVDLTANEYDRVLIIHMAAYAAVCGHIPSNEKNLLDFVVGRERTRIQEVLDDRNLDPLTYNPIARQVMAQVTLVGGVTQTEAAELFGRLILTRDRQAAERKKILEMLHWLYPGKEDHGLYISAIEPDLLGEHFIAILDNTAYEEALSVALGSSEESFVIKALTHANRIARKSSAHAAVLERQLRNRFLTLVGPALETAKAEPDPMADLLTTIAREGVDPEILAPLEPNLPERTTTLREFALITTQAALDITPNDVTRENARLCLNLSTRLGSWGKTQEALDAVKKSVFICEQLLQIDYRISLDLWIAATNNLGNRLAAMGRDKEALEVTNNTLNICCHYLPFNEGYFLPLIAKLHNNIGNRLGILGKKSEALIASQKSVKITEELLDKDEESFLPDLANYLINLAGHYKETGNLNKALETAKKAEGILRKLVKNNRDAHLPELAGFLHNMGTFRICYMPEQDPLKMLAESVVIYRELVAINRNAFLDKLAMALGSYARQLIKTGNYEEALLASQEQSDYYSELVEKYPDIYSPELAMAKNILAACLTKLERWDEAIGYANDALNIYHELKAEKRDAFNTYMGHSLMILGECYGALDLWIEASVTFRKLVEAQHDNYLPNLAISLNKAGQQLRAIDRHAEALPLAQECVQRFRDLVKVDSDSFLPDLADSLYALWNCQTELSKYEEALSSLRESVDLYRQLAGISPDDFMPRLANSLYNLAISMSRMPAGQQGEALTLSKEAVDVYRLLVKINKEEYIVLLAASLINFGNLLSEAGKVEDALEIIQQAEDIHRDLSTTDRETFLPHLASTLNDHVICLCENGKWREADTLMRELIGSRRELAKETDEDSCLELIKSLGLSQVINYQIGDNEKALKVIEEAFVLLLPMVTRNPDACSTVLASFVNDALFYVQQSGIKPSEIIRQGIQMLADLQH